MGVFSLYLGPAGSAAGLDCKRSRGGEAEKGEYVGVGEIEYWHTANPMKIAGRLQRF